jgi:CBS-domain-containing membrane protein
MARDVVSVRPDTDVAEAIKLLAEHDVGALPVLDRDDNLVGMLSAPSRSIVPRSAQKQSAKRCSHSRKAWPGYRGLPLK